MGVFERPARLVALGFDVDALNEVVGNAPLSAGGRCIEPTAETDFTDVRRFHNNRKRLFSNAPLEVAAHLAKPLVYRILAPFWTQIWLRARAK